jgi:hypothetical protein
MLFADSTVRDASIYDDVAYTVRRCVYVFFLIVHMLTAVHPSALSLPLACGGLVDIKFAVEQISVQFPDRYVLE